VKKCKKYLKKITFCAIIFLNSVIKIFYSLKGEGMDIIFSVITLVGGLAFFLFGMDIMSANLEKLAGGKLESLLKKMTAKPIIGWALGVLITSVIQSSSATTVMLVGLVNSGIMQFSQTISVIFGAKIGTTITAWILSLNSIDGTGAVILKFLKPEVFSLVFAFIGTVVIMFSKKEKRKDIGIKMKISRLILCTAPSIFKKKWYQPPKEENWK
jgi:phosphate:Na+ symporter